VRIPWVEERHFRRQYDGSVDKVLQDHRLDLVRLKSLRDQGPDGEIRATYSVWDSTLVPSVVAEDVVSRL